jgi:hypothetical protein
VTAVKSVGLLPLSFLILLSAGFFTQAGELPRWQYPDPCGAFTIGRSVLGGCDGLGGPPESSTAMERLLTTWVNVRSMINQMPPPYGSDKD